VWKYEGTTTGSKFTGNRPTAGSREEKKLLVGEHPIQLYSLGTPNGQKVTILLEELLEAGKDAEYDAWSIQIMEGDQFGSDFVAINPNSKIPAMTVYEKNPSESTEPPLRLFESGSMLLYLAEKYNMFLPPGRKRTETMNWLFWQMGSAPFVGGGFGHFYVYADVKQKYPIDRFTMETKRQLDVLNQHLAKSKNMVGDDYTIADIAIFPWYGQLVLGRLYKNADIFLNVEEEYPHVIRWAREIDARPAVKRGLLVNVTWGDSPGLKERHDAKDFEKLADTASKL
jgi:GST-like protein